MSSTKKVSARLGSLRAEVADAPTAVGDGTLAALRDTLTALRDETGPKAGHGHPRELAPCWTAVFHDLEKIEQAFLCQEELSQTLAKSVRKVVVARRAAVQALKAERLRHTVLGMDPPSEVMVRNASPGAILR